MVGVFENGESAQDFAGFEHLAADGADGVFQAELVSVGVIMLCAGEFAEADGDHLEQAAFDLAHEIGVPLHAAAEHDAIAFVGVAVHIGLDALGRFAERHHVERTAHRAADSLLDDAVVGEHVGLALGGGGAVAAHGWKDEGAHALRLPVLDGGARDGGDIGDAAAAHADGHAGAGLEARGESGSVKLALDFGGYIGDAAVGKMLAYQEKAGELHRAIVSEVILDRKKRTPAADSRR